MSIEKRIERLEEAMAAVTAPEHVVFVHLHVITSREQLERERAEEQAAPPKPPRRPIKGRVRLVLVNDAGNPIDLEATEPKQRSFGDVS
jgi:hypothetical protein